MFSRDVLVANKRIKHKKAHSQVP